MRKKEECTVCEREERVAQEFTFFRGSIRCAAVFRLIHGEEVRANTFGELGRLGGALRKPWFEDGAEAALPCPYIGKVTSIDEVGQKSRGEFQNLFEEGVPRGMRAVRCIRGNDG